MKKIRIISVFILLAILISSCQDSLKYRLRRRLQNFRDGLPEEIRDKFDNSQYEEAGLMLDQRLVEVKSYIDMFDTDEKKRKYIIGNYKGLEKDIQEFKIPEKVLEFNQKLYPVIDFECIPAFTGPQVVDYFKVYFKEKLESMQ